MRYVALTAPFLVVLLGTPMAVGVAGDGAGAALARATVDLEVGDVAGDVGDVGAGDVGAGDVADVAAAKRRTEAPAAADGAWTTAVRGATAVTDAAPREPSAARGRVATRGRAATGEHAAATVDARRDAGPRDAAASALDSDLLRAPVVGTIPIPSAAVERALRKKDVSATAARGADGVALGARLAGVSQYGVGLRDGDVVVAVGVTRTRDVGAMVDAALAAAASGAPALRGRILRGDRVYEVVLALPDRAR